MPRRSTRSTAAVTPWHRTFRSQLTTKTSDEPMHMWRNIGLAILLIGIGIAVYVIATSKATSITTTHSASDQGDASGARATTRAADSPFPVWAIVVIALFVLTIISIGVVIYYRKELRRWVRGGRTTVDNESTGNAENFVIVTDGVSGLFDELQELEKKLEKATAVDKMNEIAEEIDALGLRALHLREQELSKAVEAAQIKARDTIREARAKAAKAEASDAPKKRGGVVRLE